MTDINQPIIKETTLVQGCATGHHTFDSNSSMLGMHNGVLEMRMKCVVCAAQVAYPTPTLGTSLPPESMPKEDGKETTPAPEQTITTVPSTDKPSEGIIPDPPWAEQVRDRFQKDKMLDNFWDNIKNAK